MPNGRVETLRKFNDFLRQVGGGDLWEEDEDGSSGGAGRGHELPSAGAHLCRDPGRGVLGASFEENDGMDLWNGVVHFVGSAGLAS